MTESAVLAASGAAFAVCSVLFVRRLCYSLRELHFDFGCEKTSLKPLVYAEILYTAYALMNIAAFAMPVLYPWLLLPRILLSVAFIAVFLLTYRRICEEYVAIVSTPKKKLEKIRSFFVRFSAFRQYYHTENERRIPL